MYRTINGEIYGTHEIHEYDSYQDANGATSIQLSGIRNRENAERIMQVNEAMISYPRFEVRIEDCIVPEGTYIAEY